MHQDRRPGIASGKPDDELRLRPDLSEGAIKSPIFQTSTFVFKTAEEGKAFFEIAYGLRERAPDEELGLIYSRLNNPDLEILEDRLTLWDRAEGRRFSKAAWPPSPPRCSNLSARATWCSPASRSTAAPTI